MSLREKRLHVTDGQLIAGDTVWYVTAQKRQIHEQIQLFEDKDPTICQI